MLLLFSLFFSMGLLVRLVNSFGICVWWGFNEKASEA
jgi:hypothetical protein